MNEKISKFLVPEKHYTYGANQILARSIERLASCQRILGPTAFIVEEKTTKKITDVGGKINCSSKLCTSCSILRGKKEQKKLEELVKKFRQENPNGKIAMLTIGFPPLTDKEISFYEKKAVEIYYKEAKIKREIMNKFLENLTRTTNFISGYFKAEEITVSSEKFFKGKLVKGNGLNIHWHILLLLNENVPDYSSLDFSFFFFKKVFRAYLQKTKKLGLKPKLMRQPFVEKSQIKGAVVFEYERSERNSLENYLTKWRLESEVTRGGEKDTKNISLSNLLESKRPELFKRNYMKTMCLLLYNHRTAQYSKVRNEKKLVAALVKKSPKKSAEEMIKRFIREESKENEFKKIEDIRLETKKKRIRKKPVAKEETPEKDYKPLAMFDHEGIIKGEESEQDEEQLQRNWQEYLTSKKNKVPKIKKPKINLGSAICLPG